MLKFIAFAWDATDHDAQRAAQALCARISSTGGWHRALAHPGLVVFSSGAASAVGTTHWPLRHGAGIVLGNIFERNGNDLDPSPDSMREFSEAETECIVREGPKRLIARYWGWYVAFLVSHSKRICILRSPMSDLPCLHTVVSRVSIIFSRAEDIASLRLWRPTIDWSLIQLQVGFGTVGFHGQSAIREMSMVERGEALWIDGEKNARQTCWDPSTFVNSPLEADTTHIADLLRAAVKRCVHTWAAPHRALMLRLSGGFDSSLMLTCLATVPSKPAITCLNYYWDGSLVDERAFARAAAQHTRARLLELRFGTEHRLSMLSSVRRTPAPFLDAIDWQENVRERSLAREANATAIFMGSLGDAIFQRNPSRSAAADYLQTRGIDTGFFRTLLTAALQQRHSVWRMLLSGVRDTWSRSPGGPWSVQEHALREGLLKERGLLVDEEAVESLLATSRTHTHPWLRNAAGLPAAKRWQISGLFTDAFYDRHFIGDDDPPIIAAYMSQPLVELCLRIPSHLNISDGWERAMARKAFADELPQQTLHRYSKGSPETWMRAMVTRDAEFVHEFLLDGMLVKERIVNRQRLEAALPGRISTRASGAGNIMNLLYTEAWLRAWSGAGGVLST